MSGKILAVAVLVLLAAAVFLVQSPMVSAVTLPGQGSWMTSMTGNMMGNMGGMMQMMDNPEMARRMAEMHKLSPEEMMRLCGEQMAGPNAENKAD